MKSYDTRIGLIHNLGALMFSCDILWYQDRTNMILKGLSFSIVKFYVFFWMFLKIFFYKILDFWMLWFIKNIFTYTGVSKDIVWCQDTTIYEPLIIFLLFSYFPREKYIIIKNIFMFLHKLKSMWHPMIPG